MRNGYIANVWGLKLKYAMVKVTKSAIMKSFRKNYFIFKSFVKIEWSYAFTINMFNTAENCMEKWIIL